MAKELPPPPQRIHGRERELGVIGAMLDRARDGHGGALAIVADAGMGATALLEASAATAAPRFRILGTTGVPRESAVPYAGLHRLLRPLSGLIAELPSAHRDALGAISGGPRHDTPFVLYAAVCELLSRAARGGPVLCWADDVQWLDRVSLEALAFAARRVQDEPVAVLFAARGEGRAPDGLAGIRRLHLAPLDEDASLQVLQDALGGGTVGGDLADEVVDLACGVPLAIRDLAAALTAGQLSGTAPPPRSLPADSALRALHRRRCLRLPAGAQRLVLMAVADEWLSSATVARAMRTDGARTDGTQTDGTRTGGIGPRDVEAARASGLLRFEGEAVTVRNRLVRSSLWADASREERQGAHALLAEVLVQEWQRPRRLWHRAAVTGEPDDRLADELAAAARASQDAGRYADSWRVWQRAAALTAERGTRSGRLLSAAGDAWASGRSRRARSLLREARPHACAGESAAHADLLRGEIEVAAGSPAAAVPLLRDAAERLAGRDADTALTALMWAAEAADAAGDHDAYLEIAGRAATLPRDGTGPRTELMLTHLAGMAATIRGRYAEAAQRLGRSVLLGAEVTDPAAQTWAALSAFVLGDAPATRTLAAGAVASARRAGNAPLESFALAVAGRCEALLGHPPSPIAACHDGLRLARATRLHAHAAEQLATLALTASFNGDENTAHGHLEPLSGAAGRRGLTRAAAFGSWAPACLDLAADRPADAAARLSLPGRAGLAHPPARLLAVPHLVEALVLAGERDQAVQAFEHYRRWTDGTAHAPARAALARRCQALLAACDAEAEEQFTGALRLHETAGAVFDLARTELLFGHRLRRGRRPRAAREHLRAALRIFERYDAVPWTLRARAELRAAGETIAPPPASGPAQPAGVRESGADGGGPGTATATRTADGFGDLTAQQAHIARLAAEGATNREIAARLLLSPRTIDHHLRNVFTRLGIRSRVELARLIR
ncbi:LuxR family transcriptional regulator [Actinomadura sp. 7K507]|uniref:helix-turn-helix transcriptional regulator n=1 Tax=Actinomadura sp. 7K507 TaxID=2530365 RepID=UPI0010432CC8|nr:LuxR family transcriptional regulator [Actinomadura sp. 7K507]TDC98057.1 helix-turn-helix transcriptional regulator [Actinomadura sp. 7K507]